MAGPNFLPQGRILPVPPALLDYRGDPSGVQVPAPPGFMYYKGRLIPVSRAVTPDEQAWRNAGGAPDLSPAAANPDAYTSAPPGQPNFGSVLPKPVDVPPAPYDPPIESRFPRSGGPRLAGPQISLSPDSQVRGTTVTGLTPRLKSFSEVAGEAMDWLNSAFDKAKGTLAPDKTAAPAAPGGPAAPASPVPTAPQPDGGRLLMGAMFGNNPRTLPPQDFPVPQTQPPAPAIAGAPVNADVMSSRPTGPNAAFSTAAAGGTPGDQPYQPGGLTEFGLRLMQASEGGQGPVGPSLFGAVANAGLGQIDSQRALAAGQGKQALEWYKVQAEEDTKQLLASVDSRFKLMQTEAAAQGLQVNKAQLQATIEKNRQDAIEKVRSNTTLMMTDPKAAQDAIDQINRGADATLSAAGLSGANTNNNPSSDQYEQTKTINGKQYGLREGKVYGPL